MALAKRNSVEETEVEEKEVIEAEVAEEEIEEEEAPAPKKAATAKAEEAVLEEEEEEAPAPKKAATTKAEEAVLEEEEEEEEEAPAPKKAVTTKTDNSIPMAQAMSDVVKSLAESGFEGLELDYRSFPIIKLAGGNFETSEEEDLGSQGFICRIINTKSRYVVAQKGVEEDEQEIAYCLDKADILDPSTECGEKVAAWKEAGIGYEAPKQYIDALAIIEDESSSMNGKIVSLQIPPSSISRFSGYTTTQTLVQRKKPHEYLTAVSRGKKVTGVAKPFYPWAFDLA